MIPSTFLFFPSEEFKYSFQDINNIIQHKIPNTLRQGLGGVEVLSGQLDYILTTRGWLPTTVSRHNGTTGNTILYDYIVVVIVFVLLSVSQRE